MRKLIMMNVALAYKLASKGVLWPFFNNIEGLGNLQERSIFLQKWSKRKLGSGPTCLPYAIAKGV
jgi:hypothetical protein